MTWLRIATEVDYQTTFSEGQTDYSPNEDRHTSPDGYGPDGRSNKEIPGGSSTVTKSQQPICKHKSTDFNDPMQPSSNPSGSTWDAPGSSAPEGDSWGKQSGVVIHLSFQGKSAYDPAGWSFNRSAAFSDFVDNAASSIERYKRCGMQRESAAAALNKIYAALFTTTPWVTQLATRFLDRIYGTTKAAKCETSAVADSMNALIDTAFRNGMPKEAARAYVSEEFSAWLDNSPETSVYLQACLDRAYGAKLCTSEVVAKYKVIRLASDPNSTGVVMAAVDTAESTNVSVCWLSAPISTEDISSVPAEGVVVLRDATQSEIQMAEQLRRPSSLIVHKSAGTYYLNLFLEQNPLRPMAYTAFRNWCINASLTGDRFLELERVAVSMGVVHMPEGISIAAADVIYAPSDGDLSKAKKFNVPDEAAAPPGIKSDDNSTDLVKMKKAV